MDYNGRTVSFAAGDMSPDPVPVIEISIDGDGIAAVVVTFTDVLLARAATVAEPKVTEMPAGMPDALSTTGPSNPARVTVSPTLPLPAAAIATLVGARLSEMLPVGTGSTGEGCRASLPQDAIESAALIAATTRSTRGTNTPAGTRPLTLSLAVFDMDCHLDAWKVVPTRLINLPDH